MISSMRFLFSLIMRWQTCNITDPVFETWLASSPFCDHGGSGLIDHGGHHQGCCCSRHRRWGLLLQSPPKVWELLLQSAPRVGVVANVIRTGSDRPVVWSDGWHWTGV